MGDCFQSAELDEIWSLFAQEGRENLTLVEGSLLKLEHNPADAEEVAALFRAMHSFKGGARMMGLSVVETLAHQAEDLIALVRDEGVALQAAMIDLLLAVQDRLRMMLDDLMVNRRDADPEQAQDLVAALQAILAQYAPSAAAVKAVEPVALPISPGPEQVAAPLSALESEPPAVFDLEGEAFSFGAQDPPADLPPPSKTAAFLQTVQGELGQLHSALEMLAAGDGADLAQIQARIEALQTAAEESGYQRLSAVLDELRQAVQRSVPWPGDTAQDAARAQNALPFLQSLEWAIFEELTRIEEQQTVTGDGEPAEETGTDIAWLFRHWNAERASVDLVRLKDTADALERLDRRLMAESSALQQTERLAQEAIVCLRAIYHSCVFYRFDLAVHLALALEDLYARIVQGELQTNAALLDLTRTFVVRLGTALDALRAGEEADLDGFQDLIGQAESILFRNTDGPVVQITRNVLDALDLPREFKDVITPESLTYFSRALQAGEHFYTVLADLEQDEALGQAFFEWAHSEGIRLITNITAYQDGRALYDFMFSASHSKQAILEAFARMDPQGKYFALKACALRPEMSLSQIAPDQPGPLMGDVSQAALSSPRVAADVITVPEGKALAGEQAGVSATALAGLLETVGEMVADHATLRGVVRRLEENDLVESVLRVVHERQGAGDGAQLRHDLQSLLSKWTEGLDTLEQVETEMGEAMGRMQELTRSLSLVPANSMLDPLRRLVQELMRRRGKLIELEVQGSELELDRSVLHVLTEPLHRLVWFAVTHGIEEAESRRAAGKPAAGQVSVRVSTREDHVQVIVEDDGQGLDADEVLQRAQQLGWLAEPTASTNGIEYVLRPGFGPVGGCEGVDLAALSAGLQARQGRLSVTSVKGGGSKFTIRLPHEMAVVDGLVVRTGDVRYVVPVTAVRRIVKPEAANLVHASAAGCTDMLRLADEFLQIWSLNGRGNHQPDQRTTWLENSLIVIVESEQGAVALVVDELLGRQQVLVRPLQGQLANVRQASGCALLGGGAVGMVLNLGAFEAQSEVAA